MPQKVEGNFDKDKGIFHITFHYPDHEEGSLKSLGSDVQLKVGKHSGKILGFEVETKKSDIREIKLKISELVHNALEDESSKLKINQKKNYTVIGKVLDEYQDDLYKELAPA